MKRAIFTICAVMQSLAIYGADAGWSYVEFTDKPAACRLVLEDRAGGRCEYIYMLDANAEKLERMVLDKVSVLASGDSASYVGACRVYRWSGHKYIEGKSGERRVHLAVFIPVSEGAAAFADLSADSGHTWNELAEEFMAMHNTWAAMLEAKMRGLK